MWWRLKRSEYNKQKGFGNKKSMRNLVESGKVPGLMAYLNDEPVGWISVGPRTDYSALERSRILKPVDDQPVWSIVCIFIHKKYRGMGLSIRLIEYAVEFARQNGVRIVEGYPVEPKNSRIPEVFAYTGLASSFRQAGFKEVARRSETRPIMRFFLE
ncbi:MAG: GNAT family N-acetyltransferase [Calditrichaeota bacterium]|nr:GNAT family N-acetyltransferase [Calditrichota bacterium]RQV92508.1 MAG: GNAT family N-acetyltransferase [bacterium]RQV99364.1 MAG: GNAT family N-acetyltransferase [Calditrichota bacterium]